MSTESARKAAEERAWELFKERGHGLVAGIAPPSLVVVSRETAIDFAVAFAAACQTVAPPPDHIIDVAVARIAREQGWTLPDTDLIDFGATVYKEALRISYSGVRVGQILKDAQEKVRPIVEHERQGENIGQDIMEFRMKGMSQQDTFDFLLKRHQKLLEIEGAAPAVSTPLSSESEVMPHNPGFISEHTISASLKTSGLAVSTPRCPDVEFLANAIFISFPLGLRVQKESEDLARKAAESVQKELAQFFQPAPSPPQCTCGFLRGSSAIGSKPCPVHAAPSPQGESK